MFIYLTSCQPISRGNMSRGKMLRGKMSPTRLSMSFCVQVNTQTKTQTQTFTQMVFITWMNTQMLTMRIGNVSFTYSDLTFYSPMSVA